MGSPDFSDGSMLALYPPASLAAQLAVPGGLPPDEMHLTIAYTGAAADIDRDTLRAVAASLARRGPIHAQISGHARFTGGDTDVIVALADGPDIEALRRDAMDALGAAGIDVPREHGFCAHLTIAYIAPDAPAPVLRLSPTPLLFNTIHAVHADDRTGYTLTETLPDVRPFAREAFAAGWASVPGAPMTREVKAGCVAAVDWAAAHVDHPDVLEATLHLGRLEGTWALIYLRRLQRERHHQQQVAAAWRRFVELLALSELVRRFHSTAQRLPDTSLAALNLQALTMARQSVLTVNAGDPRYVALLAALTAALADAHAEGQAAGHVILDPTADIAAAYDEATHTAGLATWGDAPQWLTRILAGAAALLGKALARGYDRGDTPDELDDSVDGDLVDGDDDGRVRPVAGVLDVALGKAFTLGSLAAYAAADVATVDFWTVGDARVCATCDALEAGNPYPINAAPAPAIHAHCRCILTPSGTPVPGMSPDHGEET